MNRESRIVNKTPCVRRWALFAILLASSLLLLAPAVQAACSPPSDYSSCPIAQTGPKIAGNINIKNYEQIRNEYNSYNPGIANQQIPVTVIYTTQDLSPGHLQDTIGNLQAMQNYGLYPIIRLSSSVIGEKGWDRITTSEAQTAAQVLNQAFSTVQFSQTPVVYFGNEPNLKEEWGGQADAAGFAQIFGAFIEAAGSGREFQIFIAPVSTSPGEANQKAATDFMQTIINSLGPLAANIDGAALTLYQQNAGELSKIYQELTQFYQSNGINNFVISEIGYWDGRLFQNPGDDMNVWATEMSKVFAALQANPNLFPGTRLISTSFFLDTNGDGFPDVTLLVVIDENGNVTIMELATLGGGILSAPLYGLCKAEEPLNDEVVTRGESFQITLASCFGKYDDPNEAKKAIEAIIRTQDFDFADNQPITQPLNDTLDRLTPYQYTNLISDKTTLGKISYEVCEQDSRNWFWTEEGIDFKTAPWVNRLKTEGREVAARIMPLSAQVLGEKTEQPRLLAQNTSEPYAETSFTYEDLGNGKFKIHPITKVYNIISDFNPHQLTIQSDQAGPFSFEIPITGARAADPYVLTEAEWVNYGSFPAGGLVIDASSPEAIGLNYHVFATAQGGKDFYASSGAPIPIPTPTPRLCQPYFPEGGDLPPQEIPCVEGECGLSASSTNPAYQFFQNLIQAGQQITQEIEKQLLSLLGCRQKTYWITPLKREPHTGQIDLYLRSQSLAPFRLLFHQGSDQAFEFEHALENSSHAWKASPEQETESILEIYGQKGVKDSYDWVQQSLTPYRGLPR